MHFLLQVCTYRQVFEYSFLFKSQQTVDCLPGIGLGFTCYHLLHRKHCVGGEGRKLEILRFLHLFWVGNKEPGRCPEFPVLVLACLTELGFQGCRGSKSRALSFIPHCLPARLYSANEGKNPYFFSILYKTFAEGGTILLDN